MRLRKDYEHNHMMEKMLTAKPALETSLVSVFPEGDHQERFTLEMKHVNRAANERSRVLSLGDWKRIGNAIREGLIQKGRDFWVVHSWGPEEKKQLRKELRQSVREIGMNALEEIDTAESKHPIEKYKNFVEEAMDDTDRLDRYHYVNTTIQRDPETFNKEIARVIKHGFENKGIEPTGKNVEIMIDGLVKGEIERKQVGKILEDIDSNNLLLIAFKNAIESKEVWNMTHNDKEFGRKVADAFGMERAWLKEPEEEPVTKADRDLDKDAMWT